jgi:hypothetical protein
VDTDHKIVGIGHNKLPDGVNEESFPYWENRNIKEHGFINTKYPYGECQIPPIHTAPLGHATILRSRVGIFMIQTYSIDNAGAYV